MAACPRCRQEVPDGARYCGLCRKPQPDAADPVPPIPDLPDERTCAECGFRNAAAFRCCVQCGEWLDAVAGDAVPEPGQGDLRRTSGTVPWASAAGDPDPRIVHIRPDGSEAAHSLRGGRVTIAREAGEGGADIAVPDDRFISGRHAEIVRRAGRYWLRDLGSTNGTFVRIRGDFELRPGDQVMIGGSIFRFVP